VVEDTITFELDGGIAVLPTLAAAHSRKDHSGTEYDITLLPVGPSNVESRMGGVDRLILEFSGAVALTCGDIQVNAGTATCGGTADLGGNVWEVTLVGAADDECVQYEVINVVTGPATVTARNILGDAEGGGGVNIGDLAAIKGNIVGGTLVVVDGTSFRQDVNLSGGLNIGDLASTKTQIGGGAVCP
jgi:hypothetical protein